MDDFLKKCRKREGLTQKELADKMGVSVTTLQNWEYGKSYVDYDKFYELSDFLNEPIENIIKELIYKRDVSKEAKMNWPDFLFEEGINNIIKTIHLDKTQIDLFGLLCIYGSSYKENKDIQVLDVDEDLTNIPYGFIERIGSIQFLNLADGISDVLKYVKADFVLKVIKQYPKKNFDLMYLTKNQICEFIDSAHREVQEPEIDWRQKFNPMVDNTLVLGISMKKAKIILPILKSIDEVHITDGNLGNPIRDDVPIKLINGIEKMYGLKKNSWKKGNYKDKYTFGQIMSGLERVTKCEEKLIKKSSKNSSREEVQLYWKLNEKGEELLKWFEDK